MARKRAKTAFDSRTFLATVNGGRKLSNHSNGDVIFSQGDPADSVFFVEKGRIKLEVTSAQGKQAVVAVLKADDFFGEGCLIGQPLRLSAAVAMTESRVMRVKKAVMVRVLRKEPSFSEMFTAHVLTHSSRVEADLVDQLFNSSEKRLARALLLLANFGKDGGSEPIIIKVSQETLATMVGTTRSRVSFFMNRFRKMGLIEYNGDMKIHSSLVSIVLNDTPPHISSERE